MIGSTTSNCRAGQWPAGTAKHLQRRCHSRSKSSRARTAVLPLRTVRRGDVRAQNDLRLPVMQARSEAWLSMCRSQNNRACKFERKRRKSQDLCIPSEARERCQRRCVSRYGDAALPCKSHGITGRTGEGSAGQKACVATSMCGFIERRAINARFRESKYKSPSSSAQDTVRSCWRS